MTALPADIAAATRPHIVVTNDDSAILTRFPTARDGIKSPAVGYFDDDADAATALAVRRSLVGTVRRRFGVTVQDEIVPDLSAGIPAWRLVDVEQGVDVIGLVGRLQLNEETESTSLEIFG
jgi:hypothetical protein